MSSVLIDTLIPIIVDSAEIAFFVGISMVGIRILLRASFGRSDWIK